MRAIAYGISHLDLDDSENPYGPDDEQDDSA